MDKILSFVRDDSGLTIVEYAVAGALITGAAVLSFTNLGAAVVARIDALTLAVNG